VRMNASSSGVEGDWEVERRTPGSIGVETGLQSTKP
jgi:hypothetical protein